MSTRAENLLEFQMFSGPSKNSVNFNTVHFAIDRRPTGVEPLEAVYFSDSYAKMCKKLLTYIGPGYSISVFFLLRYIIMNETFNYFFEFVYSAVKIIFLIKVEKQVYT